MAVDESHTNTDTFNYTTRTEVLGSDTRAPSPSQRQRSPSPRRWLKPRSEAQIPQTFAGKGGLPGAGLCRGKPAAPRLGQPVRPRWPLRERVKHRDRAPASKLHRRLSHRVSPSAAATPRPRLARPARSGRAAPSPSPGSRSGAPGRQPGSPAPAPLPRYRLPGRRLVRGEAALKRDRGRRGKHPGGAGSAPRGQAARRMLRTHTRTQRLIAQSGFGGPLPRLTLRRQRGEAQCYGFSFSPTSAGLPAPSLHLPPRP